MSDFFFASGNSTDWVRLKQQNVCKWIIMDFLFCVLSGSWTFEKKMAPPLTYFFFHHSVSLSFPFYSVSLRAIPILHEIKRSFICSSLLLFLKCLTLFFSVSSFFFHTANLYITFLRHLYRASLSCNSKFDILHHGHRVCIPEKKNMLRWLFVSLLV